MREVAETKVGNLDVQTLTNLCNECDSTGIVSVVISDGSEVGFERMMILRGNFWLQDLCAPDPLKRDMPFHQPPASLVLSYHPPLL